MRTNRERPMLSFAVILFLFIGMQSAHAQKPWEHGNLKLSSDGHMLQHEDGTAFFWMGDTGWETFHRLTREEVGTYFQNRSNKKYSLIQAVILPEQGGGINKVNAHGDLPLVNRDPSHPNVTPGNNPLSPTEYDYWDHVDYIIQKAEENGLYVGILPAWGRYVADANNNTVIFNTINARAYGEWIGNRYKNRPNIIWIMGGDRGGDEGGGVAVWNSMAEGIRSADKNHLMTFHPRVGSSSQWFHNERWLDFNMIQSGHCQTDPATYNRVTQDYYDRSPIKPVIDGEPRYENIPRCFNASNGLIQPFDVRETAYWSLFAGAFGHTYGHNSIWQMYKPEFSPVAGASKYWNVALDDPGGIQMQYLSELMQSRPLLGRVPDQTLISSGKGTGANHMQATRGDGYAFLYMPSGNTVNVRMGIIAGSQVKGWWYNPRTGEASEIGIFSNSGIRSFDPPGNIVRGNDWVLVLDDTDKGYGEPGVINPPNDRVFYTLPHNQWHQIGLPQALPNNANTVDDVFGDNLSGDYGTDWILFSYDGMAKRYIELGRDSVLKQGKGYWITQLSGADVVLNLPIGSNATPKIKSSQCLSTTECFEIILDTMAGGTTWNMLSNVFESGVTPDQMRLVTTTASVCAEGCTLGEAKDAGILHNQFWYYGGQSAAYSVREGDTSVKPWNGFWAAVLDQADGMGAKLLIPAP